MSLTYKRQNAFKSASPEELKKIFDYNEGYKKYLDNGKTERETVTETIEMAKANGYTEYTLGDKINPGDKLYYNNRGKALFIIKAGKADLAKNGVRILVAHVDSPRLDLKQVGTRRMPWHRRAKKDAVSCDKLRGAAHEH